MAQLNKGRAFVPGDTVDAADLNLLVDGATALIGIITEQGAPVSAAGADQVIINKGGALKRANISTLPQGVTSLGFTPPALFNFTGTNPVVTTATWNLSWVQQNQRKVLAAPADGTLGAPLFRKLVPADTSITAVAIAATDVDCTLGNVFTKTLPNGNITLLLKNGVSGQTIKVWAQQYSTGGKLLHWNSTGSIRWPGGTEPVLTAGASHIDIYEFLCMGGENYYGTVWGKDMLP